MTSGDTIAAISSAVGPAARMIVRLSGPASLDIAGSLVRENLPDPRHAARVHLQWAGLHVPAWTYAFCGPRSSTGEDVVEFHLPGNPLLASMLLDELIRRQARQALPGEFTARAYFNGRLDLAEAEAVAATIAAGNERELAAARRLMSGELARRLAPGLELLAQTLTLVEAGIDFSEEGISFLSGDDFARRIREIDHSLLSLLAESSRFEKLSHEPEIVLAGRPNAGKSTLFNRLASKARAVTAGVAGTTRDALSAEAVLPRGSVRLIDVAGLETADDVRDGPMGEIERQMRSHALRAVVSADAVVLVQDLTDNRPPLQLPRHPAMIVRTKCDLVPHAALDNGQAVVSAASGFGMRELKERLDRVAFGDTSGGSSLALNRRHVQLIEEARAALARALTVADAAEMAAMELRAALDHLGAIRGRISPDDVLGRIFSSFCIGK